MNGFRYVVPVLRNVPILRFSPDEERWWTDRFGKVEFSREEAERGISREDVLRRWTE